MKQREYQTLKQLNDVYHVISKQPLILVFRQLWIQGLTQLILHMEKLFLVCFALLCFVLFCCIIFLIIFVFETKLQTFTDFIALFELILFCAIKGDKTEETCQRMSELKNEEQETLITLLKAVLDAFGFSETDTNNSINNGNNSANNSRNIMENIVENDRNISYTPIPQNKHKSITTLSTINESFGGGEMTPFQLLSARKLNPNRNNIHESLLLSFDHTKNNRNRFNNNNNVGNNKTNFMDRRNVNETNNFNNNGSNSNKFDYNRSNNNFGNNNRNTIETNNASIGNDLEGMDRIKNRLDFNGYGFYTENERNNNNNISNNINNNENGLIEDLRKENESMKLQYQNQIDMLVGEINECKKENNLLHDKNLKLEERMEEIKSENLSLKKDRKLIEQLRMEHKQYYDKYIEYREKWSILYENVNNNGKNNKKDEKIKDLEFEKHKLSEKYKILCDHYEKQRDANNELQDALLKMQQEQANGANKNENYIESLKKQIQNVCFCLFVYV